MVRSYQIAPELRGGGGSPARIHGDDGVQRGTGPPRTGAPTLIWARRPPDAPTTTKVGTGP
jgi:hypothetical protein